MGVDTAPPETLFISDLHLSPERPATVALFLRFLSDRAPRAERLYILGDLFDAWIGDDDQGDPIPEVINKLKRLVDSGVAIYLMHGNRDFLIGEKFANATGCSLLPDPTTIDLYGTPALLMHGDLLCTDDLDYQAFRKQVRSMPFRMDFLSRPLAERAAIAAEYRRRSGEATSLKAEDIMDVNQKTVQKYMLDAGVDLLIHGHTHRPNRHDFHLDGRDRSRWVLAQWYDSQAEFIVGSGKGLRTEKIKSTQ